MPRSAEQEFCGMAIPEPSELPVLDGVGEKNISMEVICKKCGFNAQHEVGPFLPQDIRSAKDFAFLWQSGVKCPRGLILSPTSEKK